MRNLPAKVGRAPVKRRIGNCNSSLLRRLPTHGHAGAPAGDTVFFRIDFAIEV